MSTFQPIPCNIYVVEFEKQYSESLFGSFIAITTLKNREEINKRLKEEDYTPEIVVMSKSQYETIFEPLFNDITSLNKKIKELEP